MKWEKLFIRCIVTLKSCTGCKISGLFLGGVACVVGV